jgi:hypothetical protein
VQLAVLKGTPPAAAYVPIMALKMFVAFTSTSLESFQLISNGSPSRR